MKLIIWLVIWVVGSTLFLWAFYAVIKPLDRWAEYRAGTLKGIVVSISNLFWIVDYIYNLFTGSLIFWEWPHENPETFSARLRRHFYGPKGWRQFLSSLFRVNVNRIEAGHI
jgi:hypothetical protein